MKKLITLILAIFITATLTSVYGSTVTKLENKQSKTISRIIQREKNRDRKNSLIAILNNLDNKYNNLYENLRENKKITIFFDPAHGKLPNGKWQGGAATGRLSCTNLPEEYYSIKLSRALYRLLSNNNHIEVKTTDDFLQVLQGKSDTYNNIYFNTTINLAKKHDAFLILSEHLNNVAFIHKASGTTNIPGIHIIYNNRGKKILRYVRGQYRGFLTLYNRLDASGMSKKYAYHIKDKLIASGLRPNSWQFGAVGDTRFTYFVDFPISVIFESGFISNPSEEKKFRDQEFVNKVALAQYESLIESIKDVFAVDISEDTPVKLNKNTWHRMQLLKMARLSVYYIKNGRTSEGLSIIRQMERIYGKSIYKEYLHYFTAVKTKLQRSERYYRLGVRYQRRRHYRRSRRYYRRAWRAINYDPIFTAYRKKYAGKLRLRNRSRKYRKVSPRRRPNPKAIARSAPAPVTARKSAVSRPIILAIDKGQSLKSAIENALDPSPEELDKLTKSFQNAVVRRRIRIRYYSKRRKRRVSRWVYRKRKINFRTGIYIVRIDKKFRVRSAKRVSSVSLNPARYQNQQFLKNSHFAMYEKRKSL
jgi:N-acetylmuramoyl-L-alanine amidase